MDAQRLEEFRRKLRDGKTTVRVAGGRVMMDPPPGTPAKPNAGGGRSWGGGKDEGAAGGDDGMQVKPHLWGGDEPFFFTAAGEARALEEQALLDEHYPGFQIDVDKRGMPYADGAIGPHDTLHDEYHLLIELPPGYGQGVPPRVYLLAPELRPGAPHIFPDGSLCLDHSGAFTRKSTLVTLLSWVSIWLVLYEGWLDTGVRW